MTFKIIFALVASVTVASCGSSDKKTLDIPTAAAGSLSSAQASSLAGSSDISSITKFGTAPNTQASTTFDSIGSIGTLQMALRTQDIVRPNTSSGTSFCSKNVVSGATTDADSDHIPAQYSVSFSCQTPSGSDFSVSGSGTASMTDKDDHDPYGGFSMAIDNFSLVISGSSGGVSLDANISVLGTAELTKNSSGTYTGSAKLEVDATNNGKTANVGIFIDTTLTPDNDGNAIPDDKGALALSGFYRVKTDADDYTLQVSSAGLTFDKSVCSDGAATAGTITLKDGSNNTVVVTFSNSGTTCTKAVTYNGSAISATR